jgi:hypothetical protein
MSSGGAVAAAPRPCEDAMPILRHLHVSGAPPRDLLAVYLQDHLAGATAGRRLARRLVGNNRGTPYEAVLDEIARDVDEDARVLERVMAVLGVGPSPGKQLGAAVAEYVGRGKPNGQLRGYSPLSRVVELEGLLAGVHAKWRLWVGLGACLRPTDLPPDVDLGALEERAEAQIGRLQVLHRAAAAEALADATTPAR